MINVDFDPVEKEPEEKPIVKKVEIDQSNFEYNTDLANKTNPDMSGGFDDRLGSSEDDSII